LGVQHMSWLQRHAVWAWLVALVAGVVLVAAMRLPPERGTGPVPASAYDDLNAELSGDLAAIARRARLLQIQGGRLREQLTDLRTEAGERRDHIAVINEMLIGDSYAECPPFLQEDTTFRALQRIIREASGTSGFPDSGEKQLDTAAAVARERLRGKMELLRDQLKREAADLDARAEATRRQLGIQSEEAERLQQLMQEELNRRPPSQPDPVPAP
jgi:hypothetical protein